MSYTSFSGYIYFDVDKDPPMVKVGQMQDGQVYIQIANHLGIHAVRFIMRPDQFEAFDVEYSVQLMAHRIESTQQASGIGVVE